MHKHTCLTPARLYFVAASIDFEVVIAERAERDLAGAVALSLIARDVIPVAVREEAAPGHAVVVQGDAGVVQTALVSITTEVFDVKTVPGCERAQYTQTT